MFAYADPPYPGLARRYYDCEEVDHAALIASLVLNYPDGWALSTSAAALQGVLALCPAGVRVAVWVRPSRARHGYRPDSSFEPLILFGGRIRRVGLGDSCNEASGHTCNEVLRDSCRGSTPDGCRSAERDASRPPALRDVLIWGGRQHSHPDALVGMKPAAFCEWMFRLLGAAAGDRLVDLFPGSGAVSRAWRLYTSQLEVRRLPSRLSEAMR